MSLFGVYGHISQHSHEDHPGAAGGLTWSVVQNFPGRFDKLAVMAPFPTMADDALTPATIIGKPNPATGKPYQPPGASLVIDVRELLVHLLQALPPTPPRASQHMTSHLGDLNMAWMRDPLLPM